MKPCKRRQHGGFDRLRRPRHPHAARFLVGPAHRRLLPATALGGAIYMVGADIISRIIIPQQILPIGVVTALFGAPAFAVILYRVRGKA
uniref:Iron chelate uptake ABC transporter family permease subunit n=1 Tax=Rhizobium leguminosarum TaxID=384 RepID=A0A154IBY3_RHILE|nr:hypothetical protein A4A59_28760 [Rhizobium leguminosarum]